MEGWEEGQSGEVDWATQPLILANDCRMLTHTIAVICLLYHLYPCSALIDETSCLHATALEFGLEAEEVDTVHIVHKTTLSERCLSFFNISLVPVSFSFPILLFGYYVLGFCWGHVRL